AEAEPARPNVPGDELPGAAEDLPTTTEALNTQLSTPYQPKPGGYLVKFNLEDADLAELVNHISGLTGRRFIYGAKVRQIKVTVVSPTPVTINEAYEAFLSILNANGMTVVPHGRFFKIIDSGGIVSQGTPVYSRGAPVPDSDAMITRLYRLKYAPTGEVVQVLSKFKTKEGDITAYDAGQLLILTDTGANIRRMIRIIEEVDVGGSSSKMWIEPVYYGAAADVAKQINDIYELNKPGNGSGLSRVIAEEQTNSLVVVGTEESYERLLELLRRVDTAPAAEGRIHVLPLQHADAEELSKVLSKMLGGSSGAAAGAAKKPGGPGASAEMFEGEVRITEDIATNSLVVSSSARDFAQLRLVIQELDKKRRQVFLEAVIMDVSVDRSSELGLAYHGGATTNAIGNEQSVVVGGFNPITSIAPGPDQLQALALGVRGPELDGTQNLPGLPAGISIPAFGVFLNAVANSGDNNVLSTPHIIATDNTEAEINIGENVPLQTNIGGGLGNIAGLAQGAAGGANIQGALSALGGGMNFNAQRTDVGTKIKITPHINEKHQVRLEIQEEISETGAASGALGAVSITQRTAKTTVVVDDQQTVVIGGLMRDTKQTSQQKVPVLGDLPVLGFLFRNSTEQMRKTNLLLILTPHVIRDQADLRRVFQRKMQERQQFLDRYFVFTSEWSPPRDFTRTNGLVEDIRQAYFTLEERERIEEESKPRERRLHEASDPLELAADVNLDAGNAAQAEPKAGPTRPARPAPRKETTPRRAPKKSELTKLRVQAVARNVGVVQEPVAGAPQNFEVDRVE
ncbi:MAG: hypothetical protein RJA70_5043, partial [Pseudomonadota bacterium]